MGLAIVPAALWAGSLAALLAAAAIDLKERIIPNSLVLIVAMSGVALRLLSAPALVWINLLVGAAILVALGRLAYHDVIGGGDAKLIAASTLLAPWDRILPLLVDVALAGGLLSCAYLAARHVLPRVPAPQAAGGNGTRSTRRFNRMVRHECLRITAGEPMPYAIAVLGGVAFYTANEAVSCWYAISCSS
jgi:prepilin peptidase CpaA